MLESTKNTVNGQRDRNADTPGEDPRAALIAKIEAELSFAREGHHPRVSARDAEFIGRAFRALLKKGMDPGQALDHAKSEVLSGDDGNTSRVFHSPRNAKHSRGGSQSKS